MIDIYNEIGYIKNVLENGVSERWERDVILLTRYFKAEGLKKSEVKKRMKEKCEMAAKRPNNPIVYNHLVSFGRLNKIIDTAWKKVVPLREIKYIDVSREVVDWFLNLEENITLSDEEMYELKKRRPKVSLKKNHPINWQRTKYLWTLYIWTRIQENYLERPNMHYLQKYSKRFKEDANLKQSFNLKNERDLLYDLGFIDVNYALGIDAKFIKDYDVFNIPVTDENRVRIETGEPPEGELYNCGYWLEKQKMGSFVCQNCGKTFANYKKNPKGGRPRKYCKECSEKIKKSNFNSGVKTLICIDCGEPFEVSSKDHQSKRCPECYEAYRTEKVRQNMQKMREKQKRLSAQTEKPES